MRIFKSKIKKRVPSSEIVLYGESTPEDANDFYIDYCKGLDLWCQYTPEFTYSFRLDYYNTVSTRYITQILSILRPYYLRKLVTINWYYRKKDEDMLEMGQDMAESMHIKMNLIKI